jgi:hypothetical protein
MSVVTYTVANGFLLHENRAGVQAEVTINAEGGNSPFSEWKLIEEQSHVFKEKGSTSEAK